MTRLSNVWTTFLNILHRDGVLWGWWSCDIHQTVTTTLARGLWIHGAGWPEASLSPGHSPPGGPHLSLENLWEVLPGFYSVLTIQYWVTLIIWQRENVGSNAIWELVQWRQEGRGGGPGDAGGQWQQGGQETSEERKQLNAVDPQKGRGQQKLLKSKIYFTIYQDFISEAKNLINATQAIILSM